MVIFAEGLNPDTGLCQCLRQLPVGLPGIHLQQEMQTRVLLQVDTRQSDRELTGALAKAGVRVQALSEYYHDGSRDRHLLVVNYSGLREETLEKALPMLERILAGADLG